MKIKIERDFEKGIYQVGELIKINMMIRDLYLIRKKYRNLFHLIDNELLHSFI
jgi:hypothetical protein